jgi:molybdenum-dependent DNA-binding transcriptional regulator ModE
MIPPSCCVIIEMEPGASLGYRKALLLNEIETLESLSKAAKISSVTITHARELVLKMNTDFSTPLVNFSNDNASDDGVFLSDKGKKVVQSYWRQFEPIWHEIQKERCRHY